MKTSLKVSQTLPRTRGSLCVPQSRTGRLSVWLLLELPKGREDPRIGMSMKIEIKLIEAVCTHTV